MTVTIQVLQQTITSGGRSYPVYVGFVCAEDLMEVAEAPAFGKDDSHDEMAARTLQRPTKRWQRPLNEDAVKRISSAFDDSGNFMPNPVLLADSGLGGVQVTALPGAHGGASGVNSVQIQRGRAAFSKPLWIIDGQHRINGLSRSHQRRNPVPVVLLLNGGAEKFYEGSDLAKQFAQVTTTANPLDKLHREWLSFAFDLSPYSSSDAAYDKRRVSMEVVAKLTSVSQIPSTKTPNPWHNAVVFNAETKPTACFGKSFNVIELVDLLVDELFSNSPGLGADTALEQIMLATAALKKTLKTTSNPSNHVFTGDEHCQRVVVEAFLVATLREIARSDVDQRPQRTEAQWISLFQKLRFDQSHWDFRDLVVKGAKWTDASKKLAVNVFDIAFTHGHLPLSGNSTIPELLSGAESTISVEVWAGNPGKKKSIKTQQRLGLTSKKDVFVSPGDTFFRLKGNDVNAINVTVKQYHERQDPTKFKDGIGDLALIGDPASQVVCVEVEHYGGSLVTHEIRFYP
jgi:hypothetical protein